MILINTEAIMEDKLTKEVLKQTAEIFSANVENRVKNENISYYEAITITMNENEYEPEFVAKLLIPALKAKLYEELKNVHLVKPDDKIKLF